MQTLKLDQNQQSFQQTVHYFKSFRIVLNPLLIGNQATVRQFKNKIFNGIESLKAKIGLPVLLEKRWKQNRNCQLNRAKTTSERLCA